MYAVVLRVRAQQTDRTTPLLCVCVSARSDGEYCAGARVLHVDGALDDGEPIGRGDHRSVTREPLLLLLLMRPTGDGKRVRTRRVRTDRSGRGGAARGERDDKC